VADLTLDELLTTPVRRLPNRLGAADLILVRTRKIDRLGEGGNLLQAPLLMSDVIRYLYQAALRLAALDVRTFIFAADHDVAVVPEILPGEVVAPSPGEWLIKKRRVLIGKARVNAAPGVVITPARNLGILGADLDVAAAVGFKTFQDGPGYFHEGISLQECLVPVVVARPRRPPEASPGDQVALTYRSDRVTSNVFSVKVALLSRLNPALAVGVDAYGGAGGTAAVIGSTGDCEARDPVTGEVTLRPGGEIPVPIVIQSDYSGDTIEVRGTDPRTGAVLARLPLKNARLN
jgi:hypothetical protein